MPKKTPNDNEPRFEEALARLEKLVEDMESGDIPLDQMVTRYEEGTRLLKLCEKQLRNAELTVEKLSQDGQDTEPFTLQVEENS